MAHEHGPHTCYCPNCNTEVTADEYVRCNTLVCPNCGATMTQPGALETTIVDLVTLARLTCTLVDRCQLYGPADALRGTVVDLRRAVEATAKQEKPT